MKIWELWMWNCPGECQGGAQGSVSAEERTNANMRRDEIAQWMWEQYQEYIADM
jgi:hypothetical protein